jgi:hypothetical protein
VTRFAVVIFVKGVRHAGGPSRWIAGPRCTIAEKPSKGVCLDGWVLRALLGHLIHARDLLAVLLGGLVVRVIGTMLDAIAGAAPLILDGPHEPGEER